MSVFNRRNPVNMNSFKMRDPYLVQRGTFNINIQEITGIDGIIRWDYMGSSEFEFGALPLSLRDICHNLKEYSPIEMNDIKDKGNNSLWFISHNTHKEKVKEHVNGLKNRQYRLKEASHLPEHVKGTDQYYLRTNFWWDVENHYMFCFGKDHVELVMKGLNAVRKKYLDSGVLK